MLDFINPDLRKILFKHHRLVVLAGLSFLLLALFATIWALTTQKFEVRKRAATGEISPTPTPASIITPTPAPQIASLTFTIGFQGLSGSKTKGQKIQVTLKLKNGEGYRFENVEAPPPRNGIYRVKTLRVNPGTYNILIKGSSHLQKLFKHLVLHEGENTLDFTSTPLVAGDFNNDNKISIEDVSLILSRYTALNVPTNNQNKKFDVDGNGSINISDISLILSNYTALNVPGDN